MNKAELIARVAEELNITKKDAGAVINTTLDTICDSLAAGEKVQLVGFGTFETRERKARTSRNPLTKEICAVPATVVPAFKPGKVLKEKVSE